MYSLAMLPVLMATAAFVPVPDKKPLVPDKVVATTPFETMMKEIHSTRINGDWKQAGWQSQPLQRELTSVVDQIRKMTNDNSVTLPVRFGDVKPNGGMPTRGVSELIVGTDVDVVSMNKSIILADGNVRISFAVNCVIVARGAVTVSGGHGNVILAGQAVHVSHDGKAGPDRQSKGSLILANVWLDVSHSSNGGMFSAPDLDIGFANATTIINPQRLSISHKKKYAEVTDKNLRVFPPASNPLKNALKLNGLQYKDDWNLSRATFTDADGQQLVVGIGSDFSVNGRPRPELAVWRVTMISSEFVILSNGTREVCFPKSRAR